ncbi:class I SAM-dependent methyltransferase [Litchfieldia salsa]|uniref:Methyltransferase domain-containing protein n=1 Tax=Litchfieldia salsa TaxID=930152 RepID=A0A1H0T0L5_9BACI|nr:class I SAM-dependent methyltransferase [Litchfieldia salsa]SDP47260.1 Methyltransferase domain-containing protein [Litchfieldia salsa]
MKEEIKEIFNQLANVYEHSLDHTSLYNSEYERPAMLSQLPSDLTNKNVLDAGCAAGWYTLELVNRGANVIATDLSPEMVNSAKRRLGNRAEVMCLDLEAKLPFNDHSFDIILSSLTLHYLKEWDLPFSEFKRILKPNGFLIFSIHHPLSDIRLLDEPQYFSTELIIDQWKKEGKLYEVPFYRRPLSDILNKTLKYFTIQSVIEPKPTIAFKERSPERYEQLMQRPQFLIIKAYSR